ncbi:MAG: hypothetical protein JW785_04355 [Acidimicrobiia bacterium]|nr:hypothetical protein [Acidimicrobiia bacterium]
MRRLFPAAIALVLLAAACGDDDAASTTSSSTTAATISTTTTVLPTTAASTITTTEATTTTDPAEFRLGLARIFAGEWVGEWANTTFGSTGPALLTLAVDVEERTVTLTVDLGGRVLGAGDPDPFDLVVGLAAAPPYTAETLLFGEVVLEVEASGAFTLEAPAVPAAGIAALSASGDATSIGINLTYTVTFDDGSSAEGTVGLVRPTE